MVRCFVCSRVVTIAAFVAGGVAVAHAGKPEKSGLEKRENDQLHRIQRGFEKGSLTAQEAAALRAKVSKLKTDEAAAKADGKRTTEEKKALRTEASQSSGAIFSLKHDGAKDFPRSRKSR